MSYDNALKRLIKSFGIVAGEEMIVEFYQSNNCDYNKAYNELMFIFGDDVNVDDKVTSFVPQEQPDLNSSTDSSFFEDEKNWELPPENVVRKDKTEGSEEPEVVAGREIGFLKEIFPGVDFIPTLYHECDRDMESCISILSIYQCNEELTRSRNLGGDDELPADRTSNTSESESINKEFETGAQENVKKRRRIVDENSIDPFDLSDNIPGIKILKGNEMKIRDLKDSYEDFGFETSPIENDEPKEDEEEMLLMQKFQETFKSIEEPEVPNREEEQGERGREIGRERKPAMPHGMSEKDFVEYKKFESNREQLIEIFGILMHPNEITQVLFDCKNDLMEAVNEIQRRTEKKDVMSGDQRPKKQPQQPKKKNNKKKNRRKKTNKSSSRFYHPNINTNAWTRQGSQANSKLFRGGQKGRPRTSFANIPLFKLQKMCHPFGIPKREIEELYHRNKGNGVRTFAQVQALGRSRGLYNPNPQKRGIRDPKKENDVYAPESPLGFRRHGIYNSEFDKLARQLQDFQKERKHHFMMSGKELARNNMRMSGIHKSKGQAAEKKIQELTKIMQGRKYNFERANFRRTDFRSIDLHGLNVRDAKKCVDDHIHMCEKNGVREFEIIVGKGKHSVGKMAVIKPAIHKYLGQLGINHREGSTNKGVFHVRLNI